MITHHDFMRASGQRADEQYDLFGHVPAMTQCGNCYRVVPLNQAHKVKIEITETLSDEEHFCDESCAKDWWENFRSKDD